MSSPALKKLIAFNLDDALAAAGNPVSPHMAELLAELAGHYVVCVITDEPYKQLKEQLIDQLAVTPSRMAQLHFVPLSGAQYHHYDLTDDRWHHDQFIDDSTVADSQARVAQAIEQLRSRLGLERDEVLFVGDQLGESDIDTMNLQNAQQAEYVIEGLIADHEKRQPKVDALVAMQVPKALEPIVTRLVMLHVESREDMKRQVSELLQAYEMNLLDTHNTAAMVFRFTVDGVEYGMKIEYGQAEALSGEARWYELAPASLKPHHVLSHITHSYTFVLLRWLQHARTLEEVAIDNEGKDTTQTMDLVIQALRQDRELFESNVTVPLDTSRGSSFFFDKYHSYNAGARKYPYLQSLLDADEVRVNNKILPGPYRYVQAVQQDEELRAYLSPDRAGLIHGDAHAGNLLVEGDQVYLIDPKGADHFPLEYDTGRLYWSMSGWNAIVLGEFSLSEHEGGFELEVKMRQQYVDGMPRFREYFTEQEYRRAMYSAAMQYLTRVHHAANQDETTALYLRGLQTFDALFGELGVKV